MGHRPARPEQAGRISPLFPPPRGDGHSPCIPAGTRPPPPARPQTAPARPAQIILDPNHADFIGSYSVALRDVVEDPEAAVSAPLSNGARAYLSNGRAPRAPSRAAHDHCT